ncbi:hypothetical protein C8R45DRAFT_1220423 [Mycena sanguinolenta]|nr:hypothetical protein C8R45DRAFT_1220423 [Mycena sanguinolenta]
MDEQRNGNSEFTHSSTYDPESPSPASGMFSHSQQFTVTGGTFTNVTKNYTAAPSLPSDFRMIPIGDIDLRHQIRVDECTGVAYSQRQRACVRRVHSGRARIDGRSSKVTVVMYQGNDAEEEWRRDIAKYMSLRHPNIVQICGAASSNGIHAAIFNDDLIPLQEILDRHRSSPTLTVYIYACCDFSETFDYIFSAFRLLISSEDCTKWIRHSTGQLCTELTPASDNLWLDADPTEAPVLLGIYNLSAGTETVTTCIDSLTLEQYHHICYWNLRQDRYITISAFTILNLGALFHCSDNLLIEIAVLPSAETLPLSGWMISGGGTRKEVMPDGWTRFPSDDVFENTLSVSSPISPHLAIWSSQANHIFRRLRITSDFEDYVCLHNIQFRLKICRNTQELPPGFLFLCPIEHFRLGPSSFRCPASPAYWSLDPSGIDRLSPEDATRLGFPYFKLTALAEGAHWDSSVYEGLRQFHEAKGFDPYSRDIAQYLELTLYQLSQAAAPPLYQQTIRVDSDGEDFDADIAGCTSVHPEDCESEYPPTSACDDSDVDAEYSHNQENVHDPVSRDSGSEHTEIANCEDHEAALIEDDMGAEEMFMSRCQ